MPRQYIAIDLKSFYASVECVERGLDPLDTNLVVADPTRTEKTICLAVSPSLKAYGIPGRARLFEVVRRMQEVNRERLAGREKRGESTSDRELKADPCMEAGYITAMPRMALYIEYSTKIYQVYLRFIAPEDIHVYSIDEVFMDVTDYLGLYHMTAHALAMKIIRAVLAETGITATAGIGTNLYLCKIAMDIVAKHAKPDSDGVRIAELDEMSYRRLLWDHRPLTDFWRIGHGYAKKLESFGIYTMGDIARCSIGKPGDLYTEDLLYRLFGINAELLIDHAWGWEPCTMRDIKEYQPESNSISSGQVLQEPYPYDKARLVVQEMADQLALDLVEKRLMTDQIVLTVGYDRSGAQDYSGEITSDHYGRAVPKHAHGTKNVSYTSSSRQVMDAALEVFDRTVDKRLPVRRINITANHLIPEEKAREKLQYSQMDLFSFMDGRVQQDEEIALEKERKMQEAMLEIKNKFGKNAVLKGLNLQEGATARQRNEQIGGHKA